jgi:hypothetical protein
MTGNGTFLPFATDVLNGRSGQEQTAGVCQTDRAERQRLADVRRFVAASRIAVMSPLPTIRGYPPVHAIIAISGFVSRRFQGSDLDYWAAWPDRS